jgi:hypothetical protein
MIRKAQHSKREARKHEKRKGTGGSRSKRLVKIGSKRYNWANNWTSIHPRIPIIEMHILFSNAEENSNGN